MYRQSEKVLNSNISSTIHMFSQHGELWCTNGWD